MLCERKYSSNDKVKIKLSKDNLNKKVSGVCAGLANYYGYSRLTVRLVAIAAFIVLPVATGVAYAIASMLLPEDKYY